jgi:asparaginyl-tRNA synthetase
MSEEDLTGRLDFVLKHPFERTTYSEAVRILKDAGRDFEFPVEWGLDLQAEHERYLVEHHFGRPVILTDYPADIKAFYMKQNADGKTVRAMDVLFPAIGEIIGGSQREEELEKLQQRMRKMNIPEDELWWYLETRKFGTVEHSGFGLGFERLLMFITGMSNIRDVIPFPRTPKSAEF